MTALQPSDKVRFKDASEAEQALREAWDRCLTQGLVHPAVLAMDEMPHDKVPPRMHEPRGGARPPAALSPLTLGDSQELTAIDARPPKPFVIESSKARPGDDDPTKLMVREEGKAKPDATVRGVGSGSKTPAPELASGSHALATNADTEADRSAVQPAKLPVARSGRGRGFLIASLIMLLVGAGAAGLYFSGLVG
jgi:hypothetical protein